MILKSVDILLPSYHAFSFITEPDELESISSDEGSLVEQVKMGMVSQLYLLHNLFYPSSCGVQCAL